jgi:hypothetical protein
LEVGWIIPAFFIQLSKVVDEAIDGGHAVELQAEGVENDVDINVEGCKGALSYLEGMGALMNWHARIQLGV